MILDGRAILCLDHHLDALEAIYAANDRKTRAVRAIEANVSDRTVARRANMNVAASRNSPQLLYLQVRRTIEQDLI